MRCILLDYLVQLHRYLVLLPETLHLAINILDRYCSCKIVREGRYQLLGCVTMLIAAKCGELRERAPTLQRLRQMCRYIYEIDDFRHMEWCVLEALQGRLGCPTIASLQPLAMIDTIVDLELTHMSWYFADIALYDMALLSYRPSVSATCSLALAQRIIDRHRELPAGFFRPSLIDPKWKIHRDTAVMRILCRRLLSPPEALREKYQSEEFSSVAITLEHYIRDRVTHIRGMMLHMRPPSEEGRQITTCGMAVGNVEIPPGQASPQRGYTNHDLACEHQVPHRVPRTLLAYDQHAVGRKRKRAETEEWYCDGKEQRWKCSNWNSNCGIVNNKSSWTAQSLALKMEDWFLDQIFEFPECGKQELEDAVPAAVHKRPAMAAI